MFWFNFETSLSWIKMLHFSRSFSESVSEAYWVCFFKSLNCVKLSLKGIVNVYPINWLIVYDIFCYTKDSIYLSQFFLDPCTRDNIRKWTRLWRGDQDQRNHSCYRHWWWAPCIQQRLCHSSRPRRCWNWNSPSWSYLGGGGQGCQQKCRILPEVGAS